MKVLQTLGRHGGQLEGIFKYRRHTDGVEIELISVTPRRTFTLTSDEWVAILKQLRKGKAKTFTLTQDLYPLLRIAVPNPNGGWNWSRGSDEAAVCAVLEHEGSIDLYHGGRNSVKIHLRRDVTP